MFRQVRIVKDIIKLIEERNVVLNEYQLVMSERDIVYREIEKFYDELIDLRSINEKFQKDYLKLQNYINDI